VFLTTNRIGAFDPAVLSRVHLAMEYQSPGKDVRRVLWLKQLAKVPSDAIDLDIDSMLDDLQEVKMNGREISNTVNTAMTLSQDEGVPLNRSHLRDILQCWTEFQGTVNKLRDGRSSKILEFPTG
jgi:AAA+ superfamily predicted ATPase